MRIILILLIFLIITPIQAEEKTEVEQLQTLIMLEVEDIKMCKAPMISAKTN